jgi:hypothetical protein
MSDDGRTQRGARTYVMRPEPQSTWRRRARVAICMAIEANPGLSPASLLDVIDAAYPFGERAHHPYKAWLAERRLVANDIAEASARDAEEWAVIQVAADMLEEGKPAQEVETLLILQAPNRHAIECPTCGRARGSKCREPSSTLGQLMRHGPQPPGYEFVDRLIPHASRVQPQ